VKLLFCERCEDIFKLGYKLKTCECGRVKGKYQRNGHNAVVNGKGYSVAMGNGSFLSAIRALENSGNCEADVYPNKDTYIDTCRIQYAWIRPHTGPGNPRTIIKEDL
jgi:hypothetical protein